MGFKDILFSLVILIACWDALGVNWNKELYSQTVYLHRFGNPITQNRLIVVRDHGSYWQPYTGLWLDHDNKTNGSEAYTDAQIAPLLGVQTVTFGPSWLMSRGFTEARLVHRTKSFPDNRDRTTYEFRSGLLGYGLYDLKPIFLEQYYALFYTRLYGSRIIAQGWFRQGYQFWKYFDFFNEVFFDTFDQTRGRDGTLDLRPGVRLIWKMESGTMQLLHQRLHHFTNLNFSGRNESRSTLVFGLYF